MACLLILRFFSEVFIIQNRGVCYSHAASWKLLGGNLLGGNSRWECEQKVLLKHFEE